MIYEFLKNIPLFAEMPDSDLRNLCANAETINISAGEELFAEGSPGDRAYVIQEGELEIIKVSAGREILLAVRKPGEVIGEMALLESSPRMASVRAKTNSQLIVIQKEHLDYLLDSSTSAARALFYTVLARWRTTEAMLRQTEKMVQLGNLTAGFVHELNNPAAAVNRGAAQLQEAIQDYGEAIGRLSQLPLSPEQREALNELLYEVQENAAHPALLSALERSDREYELETWLESHEIEDAWDFAPALVNLNYDKDRLSQLEGTFKPDQRLAVIQGLISTYNVYNLLVEIKQGAERISELVKAFKTYSYLDQAPVQSVDIHQDLENTLIILRSKLIPGIHIQREFAPDLPAIQAHGSELNQVWTNIIDNAADALEGQGEITLHTRQEDGWVVVEIEDNGPGIPADVQGKIFDPFFTTKPPGAGTGLGLDISYNIIVHRHRGDIKVSSEPGRTVFSVWLPITNK